jgi:hypothetical protein
MYMAGLEDMIDLLDPPGMSSLIRIGGDSQMVGFSEKLITGHPITNVVSR